MTTGMTSAASFRLLVHLCLDCIYQRTPAVPTPRLTADPALAQKSPAASSAAFPLSDTTYIFRSANGTLFSLVALDLSF